MSQLNFDEGYDATAATSAASEQAPIPDWACACVVATALEARLSLVHFSSSYCCNHQPSSVAKCLTCKKWFCNAKGQSAGSHLVHHLVRSRVRLLRFLASVV